MIPTKGVDGEVHLEDHQGQQGAEARETAGAERMVIGWMKLS